MHKFGLTETKEDNRDFRLGAIMDIEQDIPDNFILSEDLKVKDQGSSDLCSAYAVTSASELQELVELNPDFQFAKTKEIIGEYESWGADLRSACKSATKFGSIEQSKNLFNQEFNPANTILRNWENWAGYFDVIAKKHRKQSYFRVDGYGSTFDKIKSSIWTNRASKRGVVTASKWRDSWTSSNTGIIPKEYEKDGFGHAFIIKGFKLINGEHYLIAHLSNGNIGDKGIFYFPKEVVDNEFRYGSFMFVDISKEKAKFMLENKIKLKDNFWIRFLKIINNYE